MTDRTVSHYHILEKLGEGGMGVVYKAKDTHLDRFVALKVLPTDKTTDPERIRRFVQEAKAASALNHPHIVTIYDIDSAGGVTFIAMEYIKGHTLEHVIRSRAGSLSGWLKHSAQFASAFAAAHAAGIIHRDIKPGNLMISDAGYAKVLDFGLAKLTEAAPIGEDSVTRTLRPEDGPPTEAGTILGTASYMSPEQAQGKPLDGRSDIFSFGSVLYELFTGRRAFQAENAISTLSAILHMEPKPVQEVAPGVPREVERIINRCLRKDPDKRFQGMPDLRVALEEIKEESDSGKLTAVSAPAGARRRFLAYAGVSGLLGVLLLGAVLYWRSRVTPKPNAGPILTRLTSDVGLTTDPTFFADGKLIAYASDRAGGNLDIYVQQLSGGEPHRLTTNDADDHEPDFSPDGSKIAFRSERDGGGLYVIPTLGGTERNIAEQGRHPKFSPDGKWIAYWAGENTQQVNLTGTIYLIPSAGGTPKEISSAALPPVWSPDSQRLLFIKLDRTKRAVDLYIASIEGGSPAPTGAVEALRGQSLVRPVLGAWTEGRLVFSAAAGDAVNLWQVPVSGSGKITGIARRLTFGAGMEEQPSVVGNRVVYAEIMENSDIWVLPVDTDHAKLTGEAKQITHDLAEDTNCSITPDGAKLVYGSIRRPNAEIVVSDLVTGKSWSVATIPAQGMISPRIANDGVRVSYTSQDSSFVVPSNGGVAKKICSGCLMRHWAGDSRRLIVTEPNGDSFLDPATSQLTKIYNGPRTLGNALRTSWDDQWVATYRPQDDGFSKIFIVPLHPGRLSEESEWIPITDGTTYDSIPEFSPDASKLYFQSQRDGGRCIWVQKLDPATKKPVGAAEAVYHFHSARRSPIYNRGGRNAMSIARNKIALPVIERLGNIWMAEFPK